LARRPAGVAGEHPDRVHPVLDRCRLAAQVDRAERPEERLEPGQSVRAVPDPGHADRRVRLDRAALEQHRRVLRELAPVAEHLRDRHLGRAVEHHPHRAARLVRHQQHHAALEAGVPQRRGGHQQRADQRAGRLLESNHRFASGFARCARLTRHASHAGTIACNQPMRLRSGS
jgi:hypothetical protein